MTDKVNSGHVKIQGLEELASILGAKRAQGQRVVQCHGVFDLLHIGHIHHFEQAKELGDVLVVTVTADQYVNKGPNRPAFSEELRAAAVSALECVDYVGICGWPSAVESIEMIKPDIFAKGAEYKNPDQDVTRKIIDEEAAVKSVGGAIAFTDDQVVYSSTNLINKYLPVFSQDIQKYLANLSNRYGAGDVLGYLDNAAAMKVLVVGETIIDEYEYCLAMGNSSKEPILATLLESSEKFAGGILAVANHMANFCGQVDVLTVLGHEDTQEEFVRQQLNPMVSPIFLYKADGPTIVKRRFIESYLLRKLFEVYVMKDTELSPREDQKLCAQLEELLPQYDLVVVADYGHGMLSKKARQVLCNKARFLAVNTQANASNRGFNTIAKYDRADYVSLTRYEIALEERNYNRNDVKGMVLSLSKRLNCQQFMVTQGKDGNVCYRESEGFSESPTVANQVVDTMGAGDAVVSLTSLFMLQNAPLDIVGFVGNVVGAQAVATLGHRTSIEKAGLYQHIRALLK